MIQNKITSEKYEETGSCFFREEDLFLWVSYLDWEETRTVIFLVENDEFINNEFELIW